MVTPLYDDSTSTATSPVQDARTCWRRGLVRRSRGPAVSASAEGSRTTWPGLLEKLMAVVRAKSALILTSPTPTIRCWTAASEWLRQVTNGE